MRIKAMLKVCSRDQGVERTVEVVGAETESQHAYRSKRRCLAAQRNREVIFQLQCEKLQMGWELALTKEELRVWSVWWGQFKNLAEPTAMVDEVLDALEEPNKSKKVHGRTNKGDHGKKEGTNKQKISESIQSDAVHQDNDVGFEQNETESEHVAVKANQNQKVYTNSQNEVERVQNHGKYIQLKDKNGQNEDEAIQREIQYDEEYATNKRVLPETRTAESLHVVPTPNVSECQIERLRYEIKVYSRGGVSTCTLDDAAYAFHLRQGELDEAPPWIASFLNRERPENIIMEDPP